MFSIFVFKLEFVRFSKSFKTDSIIVENPDSSWLYKWCVSSCIIVSEILSGLVVET